MSLPRGWPGSILFSTPSRPAINIAANARYGLQLGSGGRNSTRLAFGEAEYMGIRTAAERFRAEYARFTGASNPGTRRLKLLVVGLQKQVSADACFKIPPMKKSAISLSPAYPFPANSGLPSFQREMWVCMPEPLSPNSGFGMNVAVLLCFLATLRMMYL